MSPDDFTLLLAPQVVLALLHFSSNEQNSQLMAKSKLCIFLLPNPGMLLRDENVR